MCIVAKILEFVRPTGCGAILVVAGLSAGGAARATNDAGVRRLEIDGRSWFATEIVRETFADATWRERWVTEGDATPDARGGRLHVVTRAPNGTATVWWREALPADVLIEFTAGSVPPADENNAANLNLLVHAREADGSPYRFGRSGAYAEYHRIPNTIFTLTGGFQSGWARVRRNPGFELLSEDDAVRSDVGKSYRFRVIVAGGRLCYWIDDRLVHDLHDPQPLPGGHFAFRTWRSRVWWSDVRISRLEPADAGAEARPWFRSGFNAGVVVAPEPRTGRDALVGRDAVTGFDWSTDLPAPKANFFYLLKSANARAFAPTALEEVVGRDGRPTRALRMEVTGRDPALAAPGLLNRSEFSLFNPGYDQAYVRYWMKLQDNYLEACPRDHGKSWRMFFEIKEPDSGVARIAAPDNRHTGTNNYRVSFYIRRKPDGGLYWHVRGEAPQPIRTVDWDIFNDEAPVPIGRWFQVEVFFRHAGEDGLVWLAIDGRQVALRRGRTQHPDRPLPIAFYSPFKLYLSPEWLASGPNCQWIDDVEFWPDFPPDATTRDESCANRSTFTPPIAAQTTASSPAPQP